MTTDHDEPEEDLDLEKLETDESFTVYRGRVHVILNWRWRRSLADAIVSRPLTREELALYQEKRAGGLADPQIFDLLFPPPVHHDHTRAELMELSKSQLLHLILDRLHCSLPTMKHMSKEDLCTLYMRLCHIRFDLTLATKAKIKLSEKTNPGN